MRKFIRFLIYISVLSLFSFFQAACSNPENETSEKSDLESISITTDSFECDSLSRSVSQGGIYCNKNVTFSGSIKNARNIKGVYAQIKRPGDSDFTDLQKATIKNDKWTCNLTFENEEFLLIRFVALDLDLKSTAQSAKIIPLFIRGNSDCDSLWYIDRGGLADYCDLMQKSELEAIDFTLSENKDFAQNGSFTICVNTDEEDPIEYKSIQIRDENGNKICDIDNSSKDKSEPLFEVKEKILTDADESLASGRHYLQVCYNAIDTEIEAGYFLWWPESDFPQISLSAPYAGPDTINLHTNEEFSVTIFDDDMLDQAYCLLLTKEEAEKFSGEIKALSENPESFIAALKKNGLEESIKFFKSEDEERETKIDFTSSENPQDLHLIAVAWDKGLPRKLTAKEIEIHVIDQSVSAIVVTSPKNNEIPEISKSSDSTKSIVTIKGNTVDEIGCKVLQFVWVAGSESDQEKAEKAKKWLEDYSELPETEKIPNKDIKLWNVMLSNPRNIDGFYYQDFKFKVDLANDFNDEKFCDKFFLIKLTRIDGKATYSEYKILADTELPNITDVKFFLTKEEDGSSSLTAQVKSNKKLQVEEKVTFDLIVTEEADEEVGEEVKEDDSEPETQDKEQKEKEPKKISLPLESCIDNTLTFKLNFIPGKSDIPNGSLSYIPQSCIEKISEITDLLGNSLISPTESEAKESGITIDTLAPQITGMLPSEETESGSNIFKQGNKILIDFNEAVKKAEGKIILRQCKNWALPPVLSEKDFKTITSLLDKTDREILSRQENGSDMKDSEHILKSNSKYPNDTYHGTGQYIGPYKKTVQGLSLSEDGKFLPDLSAKYVLDFDIDIWETDTPHYFEKTFENGFATQQKYDERSFESLTNILKVVNSKKYLCTAGQIRKVLEKVHYHERILDVNSSEVELSEDGKSLTVTFGAGLLDSSDDLPDGREWELVIEKGAFEDLSGNKFGLSSKNDEIVIQNSNNQLSFWSDKVAKPVVRVDRYSYGLGIWQSDRNGNKANQIMADKTNYLPQSHDSIKPTGYVRTRIDCQTRGAKIYYTVKEHTSPARTTNPPSDNELIEAKSNSSSGKDSVESADSENPEEEKKNCYISSENRIFYSYFTDTDDFTDEEESQLKKLDSYSDAENGSTVSPVFAVGNGKYNQSFKDYVISRAEKAGFESSDQEVEGVYQTVVQFVNPKTKNGSSATSPTIGQKDLSIHGMLILSSLENISPFPLRKLQNGSPYLRRCYRENTSKEKSKSLDYYWVSYEVLTDASFSFYNWNSSYYEWAENDGLMKAGEFTRFIEKD
ncbi:hypothetical protein DYE50_04880 [Treponema ruminis]|uniref:Lipoprotein n=1 Tax=Treponema ruminis TaxID=744515 RepID=A0A7W8G7I3_9SPIR|nr:hypothetical protein [Treponema ruminis]MBB5225220.1 hypothetical protein [Treponema ruminis]QSI01909.1 hypothetical protein DYE50_04880 [Treponema ruminis]